VHGEERERQPQGLVGLHGRAAQNDRKEVSYSSDNVGNNFINLLFKITVF
jgi:hypothetical protein